MIINHLTENIAVASQIKTTDVAKLKVLGFKSIICNRPDGEEFDQQSHQQIERAAIENGLQFIFLPVVSTDVSKQAVNKFKNHLKQLPSPTLAYCRSGTRSAVLWSFSQLKEIGLSEVIHITQAVGYDLSKQMHGQPK